MLKPCELYFGLMKSASDGQNDTLRCLRPECTACRSGYPYFLAREACFRELICQPSIVVNCIYTGILTILLFHTKNNEGFVWMLDFTGTTYASM